MRAEVADVVATALFTAAGRRCGEAEFIVWRMALASTPEADHEAVVADIVRSVDLGDRGAPTPALYLRALAEHRRRNPADRQQVLDVPLSVDGAEQVRKLKALLAAAPPIVRAVPEVPDRPDQPVSPPLSYCCEGDHAQCGKGPARDRNQPTRR